MAEGSFFMKKNNDGCFQLSQRAHADLSEALRLVFNTSRKISVENKLSNQFGVSSRHDIQTVIDFFSFSGSHPLVGLKAIQYLKWLDSLKTSLRYKCLNYPNTII